MGVKEMLDRANRHRKRAGKQPIGCDYSAIAVKDVEIFKRGMRKEHQRIVGIIEEMKESAESQMMFRHVDACECILKAIENEEVE